MSLIAWVGRLRQGLLRQDANASRAFWSGTEAVAGPIAALAVSAGLIRTLGPQDYGVLVVVLAVSALSMAINPAIVATTTKFVSEAAGLKSAEKAMARITTVSLLAVLSLGALFLVVAASLAGPLSRLLFGDQVAATRTDIHAILLLAVLTVGIQQSDAVLAAAIKGLEKFKQQALFELCSRLSIAGASILAGWLTHDLRRVLLASCAVSLLSALLRGVLLRTLAPGGRVFALPSRSEAARMLSFGGWMWLNATATVAYGSVDRVIVGRVLGTAAAAQFHIYAQVSQFIHYIPTSVFAFSFPVFSRLSAGGAEQRPQLVRMYHRVIGLIGSSALLIGIVITLVRHQAMTLLAARGLPAGDDPALLLLILGFAMLALNIAPYYLLLGLGRSKTVSIVQGLSVILAITLALVLVPRLGLEGAALARFGYVLGTLLLFERAHHAMRAVEIA